MGLGMISSSVSEGKCGCRWWNSLASSFIYLLADID